MNKNYYLNLLHKKTLELEEIIKSFEENDYTDEYKKYLIGGYIVTLSSILEVGIGELHSENLDYLTSLIYYTRQKVVHYGYFNGLEDIESAAKEIIDLTKENFDREQKFYNKLFDTNETCDVNNIVVKWDSSIEKDTYFYKFKSKDGKQVLCIPPKKIFFLTKKSPEKILDYIVDTSGSAVLYNYDNENMESYKELNDAETKEFFRKNYQVGKENYNDHLLIMHNIINSFVSDPINSIQILEYSSNEQFSKNTIDVIKEFIFNKRMYSAYIDNNHLIKDKYSLNKMQKADYNKVLKDLKKSVSKHINEKDVFFIDTTLKRTKYFLEILDENSNLQEQNPAAVSAMLIQLFESGPKHFSNMFISSSPEFKKCYNNLLRYRQIFSHYILIKKEYNEAVEKFKTEFLNLVKILENLNLSHVENSINSELSKYLIIERSNSNFFNYKHEQYLKVNKDTYIGKKIYYSSHNPTSKSLIAILPGGNNISNTMYYKKDQNNDLIPLYNFDEKSKKKSSINVANTPLRGSKEIKADFSFSALFKAYYELKKLSHNTNKITINFHPSKSNCDYAHKDDLSMVILRHFNQGYTPIELLQEVKVDYSTSSKGFINLLDKKDNVIASIVNEKKCSFKYNYNIDSNDYFSRIDHIDHNFSKRRHSK